MGKLLVFLGLGIAALGLLVMVGVPFGRLPGDIYIQGKNSSFYFPLATCLLLSVLVSIVMWIVRR